MEPIPEDPSPPPAPSPVLPASPATTTPASPPPSSSPGAPTASRRDLQIGRRLFHLANGVAIASAYAVLFTHQTVVRLFGTIACIVYILDRVRIHYPELLRSVPWVNERFFRAEENVREAAMTPYVIAVLLTILTFPKPVALIAIYTLGIADPLAAVVGITWGRHRISRGRTLEGSLAFFAAATAIGLAVLAWSVPEAPLADRVWASLLTAVVATACEAVPVRIDDNLTIPLATGFGGWAACAVVGLPV